MKLNNAQPTLLTKNTVFLKSIMTSQAIKFIIVGSLAAFVHLGILRLLVVYMVASPLQANVMAFAVAFVISYIGQRFWTFNHKKHNHKGSILRFLTTQLLCGLALNQGFFAALLTFTQISYFLASFIVLITMPIVTYTLSKYWAFK